MDISQMRKEKSMKAIFKFLIALAVIIVVLVVVFVVLINLTPRQYHLENVKLGEKTIEELGLADTKIIDIYKSIKNIDKVKEEDVVENPVNKEEEKQNASENMQGSSLADTDDYSSVATQHVVYATPKLVEYDDTTIAYILDNIIQNAGNESSDAIKAVHDAKLSVKELTVGKSGETGTLRVVSYMDLSGYQDQIKEALGGAAGILPIPKKAYLVSEFTFTVNELGEMVTTPTGICINGNNDDPVSKAILQVIGNMVEGEDVDSLNGKLGQAVSQVVGNLGRIGSSVVPLTIGMSGVADHKLTLITHVL